MKLSNNALKAAAAAALRWDIDKLDHSRCRDDWYCNKRGEHIPKVRITSVPTESSYG